MDVLKACEVEMLIVDEADRLQPDTFPEVRDISDKLGIAVDLLRKYHEITCSKDKRSS